MRAVLGAGTLVVLAVLLLEMSERAPRSAGSDHTSPSALAFSVPAGGVLCQPLPRLPADAASVELLLGAPASPLPAAGGGGPLHPHGGPLPALFMQFVDSRGGEVAYAALPAGARSGLVRMRLARARSRHTATVSCLQVGGSGGVLIAGERGRPGSQTALLAGVRQHGRISLLYLRHDRESWWQLLPALAERFGQGKAAFFGSWTLALVALLLAGVWAAALRLLARELA